MIRLLEPTQLPLPTLLPPGRDAAAWHAVLSGEIARHLSPEHAFLLAEPQQTTDGLVWQADGSARVRYADLPSDGRRALDAALTAILSDIRRLAESGVAPAVTAAWPALREVPDTGHVFAVDGRPVLAAWGHGDTGRLARFDDAVRWRPQPRARWGLYGGALLALALLALAAGLLTPIAGAWLTEKPAACGVVPGQLDAMRQEAALENRGAELRTLLATLTEDVGRKQLLCPIAVLPPPAAPFPRPAAVPTPPPRADLPQDRWDRRDLAMLEGCWHLDSPITVTNEARTKSSKLQSWRMCFDGAGAGQQTMVTEDGRRCEGPLAASFDGATLLVTEPANCRGSLQMVRSTRSCQRISDTEAVCEGRLVEGNRSGSPYRGRFRR